MAFLYGLRFDLSAIFSINLLYFILYFSPFPFGKAEQRQWWLKQLWLWGNVPFLALNLVDNEYFKFTGKRTTADIVRLSADISDQLGSLIASYWYLPAILSVLFILLYKLYGSDEDRTEEGTIGKLGRLLLVVAVAVLIIRGSFQIRPLLPGHAFTLQPAHLGHLALNTPFVFFKSLQNTSDVKQNLMSDTEITKLLCNQDVSCTADTAFPGTNIVLIILESCSREYMGYGNPYKGYTPFLDSLCQKGLFFENHFACGRTSQDALPAILGSIPRLGNEAYISSAQVTNELYGLGQLLTDAGYHTAFYHGGKNGTMGFDYFAQLAGFAQYIGMDEYPEKAHFDGNWGIYDGPFLQFFAQELRKMPQPFGAAVFTLSAHHPYAVPDSLSQRFDEGVLPIHRPIAYADYALKQFFTSAAAQPWFNNTLFIITADHTQMNSEPKYNTELGQFAVPLLFYHPLGHLPHANTKKIVQHIDILPSIADYLQLPLTKRSLLAKSVFSKKGSEAIFYTNGTYILHTDSVYVRFAQPEVKELYTWPTYMKKSNLTFDKHPAAQQLKAKIQYFNTGLLNNKWYGWCNHKP
jgi:phosphoglycerol transferase MdoB-like AlkP superfamily enzyme